MQSLTPSYLFPLAVVVILVSTGFALLIRRALSSRETALLTLVLAVSLIAFGTLGARLYGWTIFVVIPFLIGFVAETLYARNAPERSFRDGLLFSTWVLTAIGVGLVLFALEGIICLVMAIPLAFPLMFTGVAVAYSLHRRFWSSRPAPTLLLLLPLGVPLLMGAEATAPRQAPVYEVSTSVVVNAPPEVVWRHVVAFPDLAPPREWIFRAGVAYPVRTEIDGSGAGAPRRCVLSTGAMPEVVEVWDEPRLLRFAVLRTPPSMRELSPYGAGAIHPPHLDGFYVSRRGQFRLEALPGGRTRVTGTSWYQHGLYPAGYWRLWSDWIVHQVHRRVLEDVKRLSEGEAGQGVAL